MVGDGEMQGEITCRTPDGTAHACFDELGFAVEGGGVGEVGFVAFDHVAFVVKVGLWAHRGA